MNVFFLYKMLCELEDIASTYTEGEKAGDTIKAVAERIAEQNYKVAVLGEFKRGKSSLVNAIIGADILPTDILPMTAAVTRVVYGTERKAVINYKNGEIQERTVEELYDFATKYDDEKEKTALSVREIEVQYPSVFCKNHIEILDTPGLNEHESMSAVLPSVIGEIDAAIVAVSAREPLSLTEQGLIADLIQQVGIRHIIFVVTFIDTLSSEAEKDRVIDFIKKRLSSEALELSVKKSPKTADKARSILKEPDIFGVSAKQAMDGFINDNETLLEKSRFPKFKRELLALLTADQSEDIYSKTEELINMAANDLPKWKKHDSDALGGREKELTDLTDSIRFYISNAKNELTNMLQKMDEAVLSKGISENGIFTNETEKTVYSIFIKKLTALNSSTYTSENIRSALEEGEKEAAVLAGYIKQAAERDILREMQTVNLSFREMRRQAGLREAELKEIYEKAAANFPDFQWAKSPVPGMAELCGVDVMPFVREAVRTSFEKFNFEITNYIRRWRAALFALISRDLYIKEKIPQYESEIKDLQMKQTMLNVNYSQHTAKIKNMQKIIHERKDLNGL